jgi:lipopolysaccharide transport system ATP-binding protein
MAEPVLLEAERVGKAYCRDPRLALRYGCADIWRALRGRGARAALRPGEFLAVDDVSFRVHRGERVALIGDNGAGKTTLLRMLAGIVRPGAGRITVRGRLAGVMALGAGFNPMLTGAENIDVYAALLGLGRREIERVRPAIVEFAGLGPFIDAPVRTYSSGMVVRLGFAIGLHVAPQVFLLDEVLAVGDARFRHKCFSAIRALADGGTTILLVTHSMTDVLRFADRVLVMVAGRLVFDGPAEAGLAAYQELTLRRARTAPEDQPPVVLTDVCLRDGMGAAVDGVRTHDDVWLEFALAPRVGAAAHRIEVRLALESPQFGPLATVSSAASTVIVDSAARGTRYAVRLARLPLLRGAYAVHAHLFDRDSGAFLGTQEHVAFVRVLEGPRTSPQRHLLALDATWYRRDAGAPAWTEAPPAGDAIAQSRFHG